MPLQPHLPGLGVLPRVESLLQAILAEMDRQGSRTTQETLPAL